MNIIKDFEDKQLAKLTADKEIPNFAPGDTVKVNVRIVEGVTQRVQAYEGVVIARRNRGIHSTFVVRKISHGEGVERKFNLFSPMIQSIVVVRRGIVKRAKLYYLRNLRGKAARIKEKLDFSSKKNAVNNTVEKKSSKKASKAAAE